MIAVKWQSWNPVLFEATQQKVELGQRGISFGAEPKRGSRRWRAPRGPRNDSHHKRDDGGSEPPTRAGISDNDQCRGWLDFCLGR